MKILMFYIGDTHIIDRKKREFISYDIEIGPTKYEHEFLMNNCFFYKKNFNLKQYAFCSDVWRIFKLSQLNDVIYIDFNTLIGEKFDEFFNSLKPGFTYLYYEVEKYVICNGIIKSSDKYFFKKIFDFYCSIRSTKYTGPQILTMHLIKEKKINFNLENKDNTFIIESSSLFDPRKKSAPLKINSTSSWNNSIEDPMQLWFDKWDKKIKTKNILYRIILYKFYCITNLIITIKYWWR